MYRIVPDIKTLEQHINQMTINPERYRPAYCQSCGLSGVWAHGCYVRKCDRGLPESTNKTILIPRYYCPGCRGTCSRLPSCIAPRRWYLWCIQQQALLALLLGESIRSVSSHFTLGRHTLRRWLSWLHQKDLSYRFILATHFPTLGCHPWWGDYWRQAMSSQGLDTLMTTLDRNGLCVP
jgi:hypothetical protein